jgi:hypothetical protein
MKCIKCNGVGKLRYLPRPEFKEKLMQEIMRTYQAGKERDGWLLTLEGVIGKCHVCNGAGKQEEGTSDGIQR